MLHSVWLYAYVHECSYMGKDPALPSYTEVNGTRNANSEEQNQDKHILRVLDIYPCLTKIFAHWSRVLLKSERRAVALGFVFFNDSGSQSARCSHADVNKKKSRKQIKSCWLLARWVFSALSVSLLIHWRGIVSHAHTNTHTDVFKKRKKKVLPDQSNVSGSWAWLKSPTVPCLMCVCVCVWEPTHCSECVSVCECECLRLCSDSFSVFNAGRVVRVMH